MVTASVVTLVFNHFMQAKITITDTSVRIVVLSSRFTIGLTSTSNSNSKAYKITLLYAFSYLLTNVQI